MDHGQALTTKASERYLLGEMSEPERFAFEDHYFGCEVCADDIRTGDLLVRGIKTVGAADARFPNKQKASAKERAGWRRWLSPGSLIPSAAAACFAVIAGYQGLVLIPAANEVAAPQASEPVVLRAATRGDQQIVPVERKRGMTPLALDVNEGEPGQNIGFSLVPSGGGAPISGSARVPKAGSQLVVSIPSATLLRAASWTLVLQSAQGAEIGRYPFKPELK